MANIEKVHNSIQTIMYPTLIINNNIHVIPTYIFFETTFHNFFFDSLRSVCLKLSHSNNKYHALRKSFVQDFTPFFISALHLINKKSNIEHRVYYVRV